jgi:CRP-like cAMP-binding protein
MAKTDELAQTSMFHGIPLTGLERVALLAEEVSSPADTHLFRGGEKADRVYLIQDGHLDLTFSLTLAEAESEITIDHKGQGDSVGWSAVIAPHVYILSAVCRNAVSLLAFDGPALIELCEEDPRFGSVFMRNVAGIVGARVARFQQMFIKEVQRGMSSM